MEDDWDLQAVVRGCGSTSTTAVAAATSTATTAAIPTPSDYLFSADSQQNYYTSPAYCQDLFQPRRESFIEDLHDLCKPFFPRSQQPRQIRSVISPKSLPISSLSDLGGVQRLSSSEQQQQELTQRLLQQTQITQKQLLIAVVNASKTTTVSQNPSSRSAKRRKNNLKRVCHVPEDGLSSDTWSWRKYGQKPIKGSPYPRGYYKCSTSKGCMARKQVERNRSDPGMFIITYTAEHNHPTPTHRNSLAGCTRQKPAAANPSSENPDKPSCSPPTSPPEDLSQTPGKLESSQEELAVAEDDDLSVSDMALEDDFFEGLEELAGPDPGECIDYHFPSSLQFPWLDEHTTSAGGAG